MRREHRPWELFGTLIVSAVFLCSPVHRLLAENAMQIEGGPTLVLVSAPASYLGVNIRDLAGDAPPSGGVEITAVDHDAPAGKAGLRLRDIIIAVDGTPMTKAQQFRDLMRGYPPGKEVVLSVERRGERLKFTVRLADRAKLEQQALMQHFSVPMPGIGITPGEAFGEATMASPSAGAGDDTTLPPSAIFGGFFHVGLELDPIGPQLASFFGIKDGTGLLIKSVEPGSPAAAAGLQAGDVVLKLNDDQLVTPMDWMRAMQAAQGHPVQLTIVRNKRTQTVTLTPATQAELSWPVHLS